LRLRLFAFAFFMSLLLCQRSLSLERQIRPQIEPHAKIAATHAQAHGTTCQATSHWDIDKQQSSDHDSQKVSSDGANREACATEPTNPGSI
jgi:hypothetical protein